MVIHIQDESTSNFSIALCTNTKPLPLVCKRFNIKEFNDKRILNGGKPIDICQKCLDKLLDNSAKSLSNAQRYFLEKLWFKYGNGGTKHTNFNHGFIQGFLEFSENRKQQYLNASKEEIEGRGIDFNKLRLTAECIYEVEQVFLNH